MIHHPLSLQFIVRNVIFSCGRPILKQSRFSSDSYIDIKCTFTSLFEISYLADAAFITGNRVNYVRNLNEISLFLTSPTPTSAGVAMAKHCNFTDVTSTVHHSPFLSVHPLPDVPPHLRFSFLLSTERGLEALITRYPMLLCSFKYPVHS